MAAPAQFACPVCGSTRHELVDHAGDPAAWVERIRQPLFRRGKRKDA